MDTLTISVNIDHENHIIVVDMDTGTRKISIGLNAKEAQEFSLLLSETVTQMMLENMWAFEDQQSGPKH